jgi:ornithine cyclodeaminase
MMLLSAHTGLVEALLLDNGYLTDVRTAAAGAVAARYLSRPEARVATLFGAGMQARMQLHALTLVRPITEARIWARDLEKAQKVARDLTQELDLPVVAEADARVACRGADIIVTTTPAEEPIVKAAWLEPGQHLTAMGSDAEHKNEIDPSVVRLAAPYIVDSLKQTRRLGELHHAIEAGIVGADTPFAELGAVIAGQAEGRQSPDAITFCDLTGTGVQDTAIANLARNRALQAGIGQSIETNKASGGRA